MVGRGDPGSVDPASSLTAATGRGYWMPEDAPVTAAGPPAVTPRRMPWWARILVVVLALVLIAVAWVAIRAVLATAELKSLQDEVHVQAEDAASGDAATALAASIPRVPELSERAARARSLVGDPVWMLAEHVPIAGGELRTLRVVAEQADVLLGGAAAAVLSVVAAEQNRLLTGSGIDIDALNRLAAAVGDAGEQVESARRTLVALDDGNSSAHAGAHELLAVVRVVDDALEPLSVLAAASPELFGAEDRRDYLLLFLTPAELRAGGGLPGAAAAIAFDGGVALEGVVHSTRDYQPAPAAPLVPLTDTEIALYGDRPARLLQDTTATDDFARTGEFVRALSEFHHGVSPDGVLSIDVVAVGYLLEATGPVELVGGETISADNSADLLMNTVYLRHPEPAAQDAYFAMVVDRVLAAVTSSRLDPGRVLGALIRAVSEGRIQAWVDEAPIQDALAALGVAEGSSPDPDAFVGVHLNDRTSAKMGYYLSASAEIVWTVCEDGRRLDQVKVTLENRVDAAAVEGLPWYITGNGSVVPPGDIATQIVITGTAGATAVAIPTADAVTQDQSGVPRVAWVTAVGPGQRVTRTVVLESTGAQGPPVVDATPALVTSVQESRSTLAASCP